MLSWGTSSLLPPCFDFLFFLLIFSFSKCVYLYYFLWCVVCFCFLTLTHDLSLLFWMGGCLLFLAECAAQMKLTWSSRCINVHHRVLAVPRFQEMDYLGWISPCGAVLLKCVMLTLQRTFQICRVSGAERDWLWCWQPGGRVPTPSPSFIWIMHANYPLAKKRTVTP